MSGDGVASALTEVFEAGSAGPEPPESTVDVIGRAAFPSVVWGREGDWVLFGAFMSSWHGISGRWPWTICQSGRVCVAFLAGNSSPPRFEFVPQK